MENRLSIQWPPQGTTRHMFKYPKVGISIQQAIVKDYELSNYLALWLPWTEPFGAWIPNSYRNYFLFAALTLGTRWNCWVTASFPRPDPKHFMSSKIMIGPKAWLSHCAFHFSRSHMNFVSNWRGAQLRRIRLFLRVMRLRVITYYVQWSIFWWVTWLYLNPNSCITIYLVRTTLYRRYPYVYVIPMVPKYPRLILDQVLTSKLLNHMP